MSTLDRLQIIPAQPSDAEAINDFVQPIYARTYPNAKYGLQTAHFSKTIFASPRILQYTRSVLQQTPHQCAYLAKLHDKIVGCISIEHQPNLYELHAFYVEPKLQGQGIGKRLLREVLSFYNGRLPLRVEAAESSTKTIAMYQHWGFKPASEYGVKLAHWPEWPEGLQNGYIYLQVNGKDDLHVEA